MAFRHYEAVESGFERAKRYLVPLDFIGTTRADSLSELSKIIKKCGPVVEAYPSWHPLVAQHKNFRSPSTTPDRECGYDGLDHTVFFANGFVTCPYGDGSKVIDSVNQLKPTKLASITAEKLDVSFYAENANPILVRCEWERPLDQSGYIPKSIAVPLMIEQQLLGWENADLAESWDDMKPYLLGRPHGNRSSIFVDQDTAIALKKLYLAMVESGMYGPLRER